MLKGFVSGEEKDIVRIPMKGKNLWDGILLDGYFKNNSFELAGSVVIYKSIKVYLTAGTYTISTSNQIRVIRTIFDGVWNTQNIPDASPYNFSVATDGYIGISIQATQNDLPWDSSTTIMLNAGNQALPYEPYGYQEGWEVRDNQDRLIWGRELVHYGFKIDKSNDNSEDAVIYTHDAVTMTPAHMDFANDRFDYGSWGNAFFVRDCYPVALNLDGTEAYRLDPDDYTKKSDGTASDIFYELLTSAPSDWST